MVRATNPLSGTARPTGALVVGQGREPATMRRPATVTRTSRKVGLQPIRAAIAASPIVVSVPGVSTPKAPPALKARDFADWCRRQPADIDVVILEWLRSHARQPAGLS
jgi:hypothetical protein